MPRYRHSLPQLTGGMFITDGGLETTLIFRQGVAIPEFAAFTLLRDAAGIDRLQRYFQQYVDIALRHGVGIVLDTPTWRANPDWGRRLGYTDKTLRNLNRQSAEMMTAIRDALPTGGARGVVSGCVGPRADGYVPVHRMSVEQAADYHIAQVRTFADADADMVTVLTMNYVEEAIGVALAAKSVSIPIAVSFTVTTDGSLPAGTSLEAAIEAVDQATGTYPAYYMVNCAHPDHFAHVLAGNQAWISRVRGLRANASRKSHEELNEASELDDGDPTDLARDYRRLTRQLPQLRVLGGCCGTDERHIDAICRAVVT